MTTKTIVENIKTTNRAIPGMYQIVFSASSEAKIVQAESTLEAVSKVVCNGSELELVSDIDGNDAALVYVTTQESLFGASKTETVYVKPLMAIC